MWQDDLAQLKPGGQLQTWPVGVAFFGLETFEPTELKAAGPRHDADQAPSGRFLGALVSTPPKWTRGARAKFGPFEGNFEKNREYLFVVVEPAAWSSFAALELRAHRYSDLMDDRFIPREATAQATGDAPRETTWSAWNAELPDGVFTDGVRGLRLRAPKGALLMDWFHRREEYVFSEMKDRKFMRTVLARRPMVEPAGKHWFVADPTKFGL